MSAPLRRRRDPQPLGWGWEVPVATLGGALIAAALAALTGLGIASALFGGGWVWPHGTPVITAVLDGLLNGHPGAGLPAAEQQRVPGPAAVYACVAAAELALLTAAAGTCVLVARYRRPGDARGGMATRREADHALGVSQLRAARAVIRPDRYGPAGDRPAGWRCRHRLSAQLFHRYVDGPQMPADPTPPAAEHVTVEPETPPSPSQGGTPR